MNTYEIKKYYIKADGNNYELPYAAVWLKTMKFKNSRTMNKLITFYKNKGIKYESNRKKKTVSRIKDFRHFDFEIKNQLVEKLLCELGFEDYCSDEENWNNSKNKYILSGIASYLLKGCESDAGVLTMRQIKYINDKEIDVDFLSWEQQLFE